MLRDEEALAQCRSRNKCEWCGVKTPRGCDPHHYYFRKGFGGWGRIDHAYNLIALCRQCHEDAHFGHITRHDFLALVAAREGVLQGEIETYLRYLRRKRGH
jgi:hypothetical protein